MFRIAKKFVFDAAHHLVLPDQAHPCTQVHGHTYTAELVLKGAANLDGMVIDYHALKPFAELIRQLDHSDLNERLPQIFPQFGAAHQPTAEHLAFLLFKQAVFLFDNTSVLIEAVRVSETPNTWAEYSE